MVKWTNTCLYGKYLNKNSQKKTIVCKNKAKLNARKISSGNEHVSRAMLR
jgi:hypothetical protein